MEPCSEAYLRIGELLAVVFADRIIAVSQSLVRDLKARFRWAADKIHFIPNGADHLAVDRIEPEVDERVLEKYGLERGNYIVSVGRLVPEKGFHDLLAAFRRSSFPGKLVIAGDADHRDRYSQRLLEKADHRVVFTGFVSKDLVRVFLANSSLFVLPSYNEGLPIAALEAITIGAPILLSDIEANLDLGLASGNYFKVGDLDQLRSKISQDHERYRLRHSERSSLQPIRLACGLCGDRHSTVERG
jgi:glycosyltransferase involved in cell wall biosynthesis